MSGHLWWDVARSSGMVSWSLLALSVVWGLTLSTRWLGHRVRPNWLLDLHRFLGGAAVVFVAVHVGALVADSYTHFGPTDLLVPFASHWHPVAVAWGVVGMYLLVAVEVTSLLRRHLSKRLWRATHLLSYPLFALATVHGLNAGTDAANPLFTWAVIATSVVVVLLTASKFRRPQLVVTEGALHAR
jgi:DMSO/TMAO reductase YedYZ heme-binding membrane subunit